MRRVAREFPSLLAALLPPKPVILMYHRVAVAEFDSWGLSVAPARFEEQLIALKRHRQVLPLRELARLHQKRNLPSRAVAITFDDGYACNATVAAPLLAFHGLPATIFVTTGAVGTDREFWWDDLERLVLGAPLGGRISVTIRGEAFVLSLDGPRRRPAVPGAPHAPAPSEATRQGAYFALWRALRDVSADERLAVIEHIRSQFGGTPGARPSHRPMTLEEARALGRSELVEIGAHTATHPALGGLPPRQQFAEIVQSRSACEALCGRPPEAFAYPYGDCTDTTIGLVRGAGFAVACTTRRAPVAPGAGPLSLPRLQVLDWNARTLLRALSAVSHGLPTPAAQPAARAAV